MSRATPDGYPLKNRDVCLSSRAPNKNRHEAGDDDELSFSPGDTIRVTELDGDWWYGYVETAATRAAGAAPPPSLMFPSNYVSIAERAQETPPLIDLESVDFGLGHEIAAPPRWMEPPSTPPPPDGGDM